ncbi:UNVERIFIED_CONTAM: hypothetical protein FKN15_030982 [Acipenser sinensis]
MARRRLSAETVADLLMEADSEGDFVPDDSGSEYVPSDSSSSEVSSSGEEEEPIDIEPEPLPEQQILHKLRPGHGTAKNKNPPYWNSNGQQKRISSTSEARPQTEKNETVSFSKDNKVMVVGWKDKRLVLMLSTFHGSDCETIQCTIKRGATEKLDNPSVICDYNIKRGPTEELDKPSVICDYNIKRGPIEELDKPSVICDYTSKMGAVDRADHYCASYAFTRKSLKRWRKMFFWLLEVAIVNSAVLFNLMTVESGQLPVRHKTFRKALLIQLVGNVRNPGSRKRGRPSSTDREETEWKATFHHQK